MFLDFLSEIKSYLRSHFINNYYLVVIIITLTFNTVIFLLVVATLLLLKKMNKVEILIFLLQWKYCSSLIEHF